MGSTIIRKPDYLRVKIPKGKQYTTIKQTLQQAGLHTICTEAKCPNRGECFCNGTATFLILGNICTRNCHYCAVTHGLPSIPDINEPVKIAQAIKKLKINYAVITSVTRDDLKDGGAAHFIQTIKAINSLSPTCKIEVLITDFYQTTEQALSEMISVQPDVINHNIETTKSIFKQLRPMGNYQLSLQIINSIAKSNIISKSGLMIGFGESMHEINATLQDLYTNGCEIITIGQYLQSTKEGFPVKKYYSEDEFKYIEQQAREIGFTNMACGPLVRSSYHAARLI